MSQQPRLFDGFEIQADKVNLKPVGEIALELVKGDLDVHIGDMFEVTVRYRIGKPTYGGDFDAKGNIKGNFDRTFVAYPQDEGLEVTGYVTKTDLDKAWDQAHGATG